MTVTREHDRGEGERRRYWIWNFPSVEFVSRKSDELRHLLGGGKKKGESHPSNAPRFLSFWGKLSAFALCPMLLSSSSPLHKSAIISVGLLASQWKMVRHPRWMAGFLRSRAMRDESLINVFDVSFFGISVDELSRSPLPIHAINFVFIEDENTVLFSGKDYFNETWKSS